MQELWEPDPDVLQRIYDGRPSDSDVRYADVFAAIAGAIDGCDAPDEVALFLSTCRNEYLTVNGIFVDLRLALGSTARESRVDQVLNSLRNGEITRAREGLRSVSDLLQEIRLKKRVWENRSTIYEEYRTSAGKLGRLKKLKALMALEPTGIAGKDGAAWDSVYVNVSLNEGACDDEMKVLHEVHERCHGVYRLLACLLEVVALRAMDADLEAGSFTKAVGSHEERIDWTQVQQELAAIPAVWHLEHVQDWVRVIETDLPATSSSGAPEVLSAVQPIELFSTTRLGSETDHQLERAFRLADVALIDARYRLASQFRPNVAVLPMPAPFVLNLTRSSTPARGRFPDFAYRTPQVSPEKVSDIVTIATLRCFVPENWHSHREGYWYDPRIADIDAVVALVEDSLNECCERSVPVLILPEYFMPAERLEGLLITARQLGVTLIGGVQSRRDDAGRVINEVALSFPRMPVIFQGKQRPSVFEPARPRWATSDDLVIVRDTVLGNLSVVVCSDYLEADVVAGLAGLHPKEPPRPHTIVVCARNPSPEIFTAFARADALRFYANIVIVNSADSNPAAKIVYKSGIDNDYGCVVATPAERDLLKPTVLPKVKLASDQRVSELLLWKIDMNAVKARSNRSTRGFPASFWAQDNDISTVPHR